MPTYGTVKREGDVLRVSECATCRLKDACSVDDGHLRIWKDYGMGCACYSPKSVYSHHGNCCI